MGKKRIVIALGGNALGKTLPEQYLAVPETSKAIADLIEDGSTQYPLPPVSLPQ